MSNNRLSMSKRAIRMATALALVAVMSVVAVSLLMTGAGGATAFNADASDSAAMLIPAQYTAQCSNGVAVLFPERNPGLVKDCATLLAVKSTIEGESGNLNWSADIGISRWDGVREIGKLNDDSAYRVLSLDFSYSGTEWVGGFDLTGTIPPELGNLDDLTSLDLATNNEFIGTIPPELGNLANLGGLNLSNNRLTGAIPPELGNLANLGGLNLSNNRLTGAIPPELGNLANLQGLYLHGNQLTGAIPPELGNFANIWGLYLHNNQLTGAIPPELGRLSNIRTLRLALNQLTGEIPPELGNLDNLEWLSLVDSGSTIPERNQFTGCVPASIIEFLDYPQLLAIGLPFCDAAPVPPHQTPTATPSPTPTRAPSATATTTPTSTATPVPYDALLSRLIALETQIAEILNRLAVLEGGSAIAPPSPTPTATPSATPTSVAGVSGDDACIERLGGSGSVRGRWTADCLTANSPDNRIYYARFYTFTLYAASEVTITLASADATPYVFLLEGEGMGGAVKQEKGVADANSVAITAALQPGAYTIEASTYNAETAGDFTLEMEVTR